MIPLGTLASAHVVTSTWTPVGLSGLLGWWDADDAATFTYSSGTVVSQWQDKSGNGRHLNQSTVGNQPTRAGTINSRTAVLFNGTNQYIDGPSLGITKPATLLLAARNTASSGQRNAICAGAPSSDGRLFRESAGGIQAYQGSFLSSGVSWGTTAAHSVVGVFNGATSKIAADSGSWTTGTVGTLPFTNAWRVGAYGGTASEFWQGEICEILHVNGVIADADRDGWFRYCATKWGTP